MPLDTSFTRLPGSVGTQHNRNKDEELTLQLKYAPTLKKPENNQNQHNNQQYVN